MDNIEQVVDSFEFSLDTADWLDFEHPFEFFKYGTYKYMEHIKRSTGIDVQWNDWSEYIKEKIELNLTDQWDSFVSNSK